MSFHNTKVDLFHEDPMTYWLNLQLASDLYII